MKQKLIILCALFIAAAIVVNLPAKPRKTRKYTVLSSYFNTIEGYETLRSISLEENAFQMLNLDDYLFRDYQNPKGMVNLYIGYYYTADKAYEAHSPLVCYPAQGWKIDQKPVKLTINVDGKKIHLEEIITSLGDKKDLVLYWYQTHLLTNTEPYQNKIDMAISKLKYNDEQHAFVRVSTSIDDGSYDQAKERSIDFIKRFYPQFVTFIEKI
jgi:EpsI family protein